MSKKTKKPTAAEASGFIRRTVTIPGSITDFADAQTARPEHAGNFSSYVRSLILRDRETHKQAA